MTRTKAALVKAWWADNLPANLTLQANGNPVAVSYGSPNDERDLELVQVGQVKTTIVWARLAASTSAAKADEDGTLTVTVWVQHEGWDQRKTSERAFEIVGDIEALAVGNPAMRDPTIPPGSPEGAGLVNWQQIVGLDLGEGAGDNTRQARVAITINYRAAI